MILRKIIFVFPSVKESPSLRGILKRLIDYESYDLSSFGGRSFVLFYEWRKML